MGAVVSAAGELFAERGPATSSIREIAARAGVNHGLVYRHFGSKEALVAGVLDHLSDELARLTERGASPSTLERAAERHWRVLARAILDGYPVGRLQQRFPFVAGLVDQARIHHPDETAARLAAAHAVALELGWRLFEPFLRSAAGLDRLPEEELRGATRAVTRSLIDGDGTRRGGAQDLRA
jgi:AcrR family transcriptional regulator